jgi:hypothetical protein
MADDDITTGPAQAAIATTVGVGVANSAPGLLGMVVSGANSAMKRLQGQQEGSQAPTAAEMQFWNDCAGKTSTLIRSEVNKIPDQIANQPRVSSGYSGVLIGLGAVLTGLSFTRVFPGKWKWLSGGAAAVSLAGGVAINSKVKAMNAEIDASTQMISTMQQGLTSYATALDTNPVLREKLAQYFSANITAQELQRNSLESTLLAKCAEFAQASPQLHKTFGEKVTAQAAGGEKDCGCQHK